MKHTIESKKKMSAARLGKTASPELKAKLSEIHNIKYNEILADGWRRCIRCGAPKKLEEYPKARKRRDGQPRYAYCLVCHANYQREQKLKNFFLLSVEEADKVFEHQGNVCAICRRPPKDGKRLALDHRHSDGLLRGGLCSWCNRAIARFNDNIERLRAAADYLENPPATVALGRTHHARPGRMGTKKQRKIIKKEKLMLHTEPS